MKDFGYDISDFEQIQPEYGTLEDFDKLVHKMQEARYSSYLTFRFKSFIRTRRMVYQIGKQRGWL